MNELQFIEKIRRLAGGLPPVAVTGIGDDCAVLRRNRREDWVFTTDLLLEDVHFRRSTHSAGDIGHKALARGLSDLAAMGAKPLFCLLSLAIPDWASPAWIRGFYRSFLQFARRHRVALLGGDLARTSRFCCDVVCCGTVPRGAALLRSGARPGDAVYVSGCLGGSALGLRVGVGAGYRKHLRPEPRIELGLWLRSRIQPTSCMDLSDGISIDLHRLCKASRVSAVLDSDLPVFPGASLEDALHGGEDYELLFTVSPGKRVPSQWRRVPLTRIGEIRAGRAGKVLFQGKPLPPAGYDHLR